LDALNLKDLLPGVPLVESPFFDDILSAYAFDAETARIARELHDNRFAVFRFPDDEFDARAERIKRDLGPLLTKEWLQKNGNRVENAWTFDQDVRAIAVNSRVTKILSDAFGRRAFSFQTLNFPVGSQQEPHSDSVQVDSGKIHVRRMGCARGRQRRCGPTRVLSGKPQVGHPLQRSNWCASVRQANAAARVLSCRMACVDKEVQDCSTVLLPAKGRRNHLAGKSVARREPATRPGFDPLVAGHPLLFRQMLLHKSSVFGCARGQAGRKGNCRHRHLHACAERLRRHGAVRACARGARRKWLPTIPWLRRFNLSRRVPRDFDPIVYKKLNPDVAALGMDPFEHYLLYGQQRWYR
jgi:hypothetical protein